MFKRFSFKRMPFSETVDYDEMVVDFSTESGGAFNASSRGFRLKFEQVP